MHGVQSPSPGTLDVAPNASPIIRSTICGLSDLLSVDGSTKSSSQRTQADSQPWSNRYDEG